MRPFDATVFAHKPFSDSDIVLVVGEDGIPRNAILGGASRMDDLPTLTLFLPENTIYPVGTSVSVNLLTKAQRLAPRPAPPHEGGHFHLETAHSDGVPYIAGARLAFICQISAGGKLEGNSPHSIVLVARVHKALQRWPRGCAI